MKQPRILISLSDEILEKLNRIATRKSLSRSSLCRTLLVEKLESIPENETTTNQSRGMLHA